LIDKKNSLFDDVPMKFLNAQDDGCRG